MAISLMSPQGIKSFIATVGTIGTAIGGVSFHIKNKQINTLKKELSDKSEELSNKTENYQGLFSSALNKIYHDLKNIDSSPFQKMGNGFKKISQSALDNTKDMRQSALQAVKTHPSLSVIAGGAVLYGLYDTIQKQQKTKKLKSAQKNINNYFK